MAGEVESPKETDAAKPRFIPSTDATTLSVAVAPTEGTCSVV
jgi:hypothetical protein